jgi:hypothetical protein
LREVSSNQVYATWKGKKVLMPFQLPSYADWHYPFPWTTQVSVVPAGSLSSIPAASR